MVQYRLTINRELCIDCCLASGRCPPHAQAITRVFAQSPELTYENDVGTLFPETLYPQIKTAAEGCPVHAITIETIEE